MIQRKIIFMNENNKKESSTTKMQNNINSLTPRSVQDRISPYSTNTISSRQVTRIKKNAS